MPIPVVVGTVISILGPILVKAGAPLLKRVLEQELGSTAGDIGSVVIDEIAGRIGVAPTAEDIAKAHKVTPSSVESAIRDVETSRDWIEYMSLATAGRDRMIEREDSRESFFSWGWRPAMSWLVIFLFVWAMVLVPMANSVFSAALAAPSTEDILQFAGIWLVIYGGGHTVKSVFAK